MPAEEERREVWRGRLGGLDPRARALNDSLPIDRRLAPEELILSRAYARSLVECGVMTEAEATALARGCDAIETALENGTLTLAGEDVHSAIESELTRLAGDAGRKLHTGRSRNDQVSTLLRLAVIKLCDDAIEHLREVERAIVHQARAAGEQAVAAHTHLQPAQPILLSHWWLAHVAALERDEARFSNAREAADLMPLGAGAVAGTPLRYDRLALATRLGFSRVAGNSVDAVGDRDFALEYLNAAAVMAIHLSRLAEDLVLLCSSAFGWFKGPEGFSTGSSLLPQKKNPDVFELARGKSARLIANAQRLAILLKGLPSAYQKDLQEDKEAVFDTADTIATLLAALAPAIVVLESDRERMRASLTPDLLAVELADALVATGAPFRDAHALVATLWATAERKGVPVLELPESERVAISPLFTNARLAEISVAGAIARRDHGAGTGPNAVAAQLEHHEARLGIAAGAEIRPPAPIASEIRSHPVVDEDATTKRLEASGITIRRATLADVPAVAGLMSEYVIQGVLLPRPMGELYQSVREFHVAVRDGAIVACAALRLLWDDVGEVRSLAVRPDQHGLGLGAALVEAVLADARALALPRVIALTREVGFFERCGFRVVSRDTLPRKVWTDCVRCPRRHACDEVAVVLDLVPGASDAAVLAGRSWTLPIPQLAPDRPTLPIVS
jgi:argininosuccinate lyase/amino-acid N-acetyltransferase